MNNALASKEKKGFVNVKRNRLEAVSFCLIFV